MWPASDPILSCEAARALEAGLFAGDEDREWRAMQAAGRAVAAAVRRDFAEIGGWPESARMLVLAGKGHNGGDALIAATVLLAEHPAACADVIFPFGSRSLRPLAARAWRDLQATGGDRVRVRPAAAAADRSDPSDRGYDLCLDGVFGFQFRPPADPALIALLQRVNATDLRLRAAIDLPSAGVFRADFTYATGSVKAPVIGAPGAGRIRYLDLGFFRGTEPGGDRVLKPEILRPLAGWRAPGSDKRSHGHVFILGGSRSFPGAVLMSVLAAIRSGAGLITAFVPESLAPAFAARAPEAMWVGWPETPEGNLALEGEHRWRDRVGRATAALIGPGLGREPETLALVRSLVQGSPVPFVLDADALQPEIVRAAGRPRIVTPHAGEFARIAGRAEVRAFAEETGAVVVLKGPITRIAGTGAERGHIYHSLFGGPVLARGGSGDLLAGLIGGLLAQTPADPVGAAARGVVWHGLAADCLARARGAFAVGTTELLEFLPAALREC